MNKRENLFKKIANLSGIALILLGSIPSPVLGQVIDEAPVEMAGAMDITIETSYDMLLDGTEDPTA